MATGRWFFCKWSLNSWYGDFVKTVSFQKSGVKYAYVAAIAAYVAFAKFPSVPVDPLADV